jgi:cystathionine beta-lyase/cystathionine gamma-synthase
VRTMAVRTAHQAATAQRLAEWLEQHPGVTAVHYPGLANHPQHDLAKRQMRQFGTVLAFDLADGREAVKHLLDEIRLVRCATSLGGPETLVCHPMTTTHASLTPEEQAESGVTEGLVRVSVGLEDADDVVADFQRALA